MDGHQDLVGGSARRIAEFNVSSVSEKTKSWSIECDEDEQGKSKWYNVVFSGTHEIAKRRVTAFKDPGKPPKRNQQWKTFTIESHQLYISKETNGLQRRLLREAKNIVRDIGKFKTWTKL